MASLVARCSLALAFVALAGASATAADRIGALPSTWTARAEIRLHGSVAEGVGFERVLEGARAVVSLDPGSGRFGISLLQPEQLWLLQVGALELDAQGQPLLAPDDLSGSGVIELACAALAGPAPCDAPLDALAVEVLDSTARARLERGVLVVRGRLRLSIVDPSRPAAQIRLGVAYEARATAQAPPGAVALDLAANG